MSNTVAYVRVSTDDQVDYSPDAQAKKCEELARLKEVGPVVVLRDEGWSGTNLQRPQMQALIKMIEADQVSFLVIWRWDRLTRDQEDSAWLVKLLNHHGVKVFSCNEGDVDLSTAAGRMQIGVHGVFAQFYRDQICENSRMGARQAFAKGEWQNRAPTGYDMINGKLVPDDSAPLVVRCFALRAEGMSYQAIADETGLHYSTARHIIENRVYLGETTYAGEWGPGVHVPLVTEQQFNAAQRGHIKGQRRSKDLLSGKVRCGYCGRVVGVHYNDRSQAIYRCRHRGKGCIGQPGRSASGLLRGALTGFKELSLDLGLQSAIGHELTAHRAAAHSQGPTAASTVLALENRKRKLLDMALKDQISGEDYAQESSRLNAQIRSLKEQIAANEADLERRDRLAEQFDEVAQLLAQMDFGQLWEEATSKERRVLIEDLLDSIFIYEDRITVQINGAPPFIVALDEIGLRRGCNPVVSKGRPAHSPTGGCVRGSIEGIGD